MHNANKQRTVKCYKTKPVCDVYFTVDNYRLENDHIEPPDC